MPANGKTFEILLMCNNCRRNRKVTCSTVSFQLVKVLFYGGMKGFGFRYFGSDICSCKNGLNAIVRSTEPGGFSSWVGVNLLRDVRQYTLLDKKTSCEANLSNTVYYN